MRFLFLFLFLIFFSFSSLAFGAYGQKRVWQSGELLLNFIEANKLPLKLYYNLSNKEKELVAEIQAGSTYYVLKNSAGELIQALIPVSDDVEMHIYKKNSEFILDFMPTIYQEKTALARLKVQINPYTDVLNATKDIALTNEFVQLFKKSIDSGKNIIKDQQISFIYTRKYRLGEGSGGVNIKAISVKYKNTTNYVFAYDDSFYDLKGQELSSFLLEMPLKKYRITSRFSHGRFHPILKKVRPHYGVDLAAPLGTPIRASASGRVIFSGTKGGYGKVIEIIHSDGLKTLYAHLNRRDVSAKTRVKKGQIIGRLGNTGVSTGPHLHFGVYKNNRPLDPLKIVQIARTKLQGSARKEFLKVANKLKKDLERQVPDSNFYIHELSKNV
ncbi:MAG: peptidoglycan DD-metalloendopeptidase family protein [Helicobacter sp.]|nr:peptidoglycan DD-metalloendopeptidase family protein [Helicobacter sp.]